jgi:hypothetical protein
MRKFCLYCILLLLPQFTVAEESAISMEDFSFLEGYWESEGFDGLPEEMWMPATGGSMFGIFKQSNSDEELIFTELIEIVEVDDEFVLRLKHFNPDFSGWEEKNDYVTFGFESVAEIKAVFNGLSYELIATDQLQVKQRLRQSDGSVTTEEFNFYRELTESLQ